MTRLLDTICKVRDILHIKDLNELNRKLAFQRGAFKTIFNGIHKNVSIRSDEYQHDIAVDSPNARQLDFTSQDLRELAQDIRNVFKRWDNAMNPEKNIKALKKKVEDGKLNFAQFTADKTKIMAARRDYTQELTELLNLVEYHSVFLYYLEIASNDEFAIKCTERL